MKPTLERVPGDVLGLWSIMDGPVRLAVLSDNPVRVIRGSLHGTGLTLERVEELMAAVKGLEESANKKLKGGL